MVAVVIGVEHVLSLKNAPFGLLVARFTAIGAAGAIVVPVPSIATIFAAVGEHRPTVLVPGGLANEIFGITDSVCTVLVVANVFFVAVMLMLNGSAVPEVFLKNNDAEL